MSAANAPIIEMETVSIRAGGKTLLDAVTLAFSPSQCVAVVGPNGAGKTTLLRVLGGELQPRFGTIKLRGRDIGSYTPRTLAEHRAVLSQTVTVGFPFTVAEVVRMGAGDRRGARIEPLVDDALQQVGLSAFRERTITTLSGGEQQRAHFARVLVQLACGEAIHGPGVLLLDEPTASLDLRYQLDLLAATQRCAARGVTVIAILHDLNLAALFADRIIVLNGGRVAGDGPPRQIITDDTLAQVFKVGAAVGRTPPDGMPFVLPHTMTVA
jgi:iron complex transport system ATP-binding protein